MKNPARGRRVFGELRYLCLKIYLYEYKGFAGADGFVGVVALVVPDFPRLLSCHDSTDHPLPTDFSLGRFSKHRALILLRTRLSSGEFWEFEEII